MNQIIKSIRNKAKMNQEQFANSLETTVISINRWEKGKTKPSKIYHKALLDFCKINNIDIYDDIVNIIINNVIINKGNCLYYHGSKKGINNFISTTSNNMCDFGKGFYISMDPNHSLTLICDEESPVFYSLELDFKDLKVLNIDVNLDWAMIIAYYRGYMDSVKDSDIYLKYKKMTDGYDVIIGCIADDRMYRVMKSFFENEITDIALLHSLSALDLGKQIVCKTQKACDCVKIVNERKLSFFELSVLKEKNINRRNDAVLKTESILRKYRRDGLYFDEIIGDKNE